MQMNKQPLVSVVIPCYNHESFVQDSIQSVIDQTYENIELIIIDDGSKDGSVGKIQEMIPACQKRFIRFEFRHRPNKGLSATLNEALIWCKGKYYSAIASDDILFNRKISVQVDFLEKNNDFVAVFGGLKIIDDNNKELYSILKEERCYSFKEIIYHKHHLPAPTQLIRLDIIRKVGGYDDNIYIEDWLMWLKLSQIGNIFYMKEFFVFYRRHDRNMSKFIDKMQKARLEILTFFKDSEYYHKAKKNIEWMNAFEKWHYSQNNKLINFLKLILINPFRLIKILLMKFLEKFF